MRCDWTALHSAGQQTAITEVTRPLPSLAERGVATRDYKGREEVRREDLIVRGHTETQNRKKSEGSGQLTTRI